MICTKPPAISRDNPSEFEPHTNHTDTCSLWQYLHAIMGYKAKSGNIAGTTHSSKRSSMSSILILYRQQWNYVIRAENHRCTSTYSHHHRSQIGIFSSEPTKVIGPYVIYDHVLRTCTVSCQGFTWTSLTSPYYNLRFPATLRKQLSSRCQRKTR